MAGIDRKGKEQLGKCRKEIQGKERTGKDSKRLEWTGKD